MKCRYCGEQLEKGFNICKACGRTNENIFDFGKFNKKIIITAAIAVVAVIVALVAALVGMNLKENDVEVYIETNNEESTAVVNPWEYFLENNDVMRISYEEVESRYGGLELHMNDMSLWGDSTYLGLIADEGIYYFTEEDILFIFEGTGLYCTGIAGTAEQLLGITYPVDLEFIEEELMLDRGLVFEWTTDIRDRNWYGVKEVDYNTLRVSFYNDDVQEVTPRPGYDPLTEGGKYPSEVTLDNIDIVFSGVGANYRTLTPTTHVSICIEKW